MSRSSASVLELWGVSKEHPGTPPVRRAARRHRERRRGRVRGRHRTIGIRQVHPAGRGGHARAPDERPRAGGREPLGARVGRRAVRYPILHGGLRVPAVPPPADALGVAQRRRRPALPRRRGGRTARTRRRGGGRRGPGAPEGSPPRRALRGRVPARRHRPGDRGRAGPPPGRRAHGQPGLGHGSRDRSPCWRDSIGAARPSCSSRTTTSWPTRAQRVIALRDGGIERDEWW